MFKKMKPDLFVLLNDDELILKIKSDGSSRYFEALYNRYYPKVLDKCYSFAKDRKTAEELAEDILSKAFEKLTTFRQTSSFSSWLYSITYNHCIDYLRMKKKLHYPKWDREQGMPEIMDEPDENPDGISYDKLLLVLELIHPEEKALLLMKYEHNMSVRQIGQALRISEDAVKMRLKRARTRVIFLYRKRFPGE